MLTLTGETRVDYFHFICKECGDSVQVRLGTDGAVPTIAASCTKCGKSTNLKLHRTV